MSFTKDQILSLYFESAQAPDLIQEYCKKHQDIFSKGFIRPENLSKLVENGGNKAIFVLKPKNFQNKGFTNNKKQNQQQQQPNSGGGNKFKFNKPQNKKYLKENLEKCPQNIFEMFGENPEAKEWFYYNILQKGDQKSFSNSILGPLNSHDMYDFLLEGKFDEENTKIAYQTTEKFLRLKKIIQKVNQPDGDDQKKPNNTESEQKIREQIEKENQQRIDRLLKEKEEERLKLIQENKKQQEEQELLKQKLKQVEDEKYQQKQQKKTTQQQQQQEKQKKQQIEEKEEEKLSQQQQDQKKKNKNKKKQQQPMSILEEVEQQEKQEEILRQKEEQEFRQKQQKKQQEIINSQREQYYKKNPQKKQTQAKELNIQEEVAEPKRPKNQKLTKEEIRKQQEKDKKKEEKRKKREEERKLDRERKFKEFLALEMDKFDKVNKIREYEITEEQNAGEWDCIPQKQQKLTRKEKRVQKAKEKERVEQAEQLRVQREKEIFEDYFMNKKEELDVSSSDDEEERKIQYSQQKQNAKKQKEDFPGLQQQKKKFEGWGNSGRLDTVCYKAQSKNDRPDLQSKDDFPTLG